MTGLVWHLRAFLGFGAVFTALSELLFYPVTFSPDSWQLLLVYALSGLFGVLAVARVGGRGLMGFFLAACIMGLLAEGLPVLELYAALPVSLVWTSLAWHGVVSGLLGLWVYRASAARGAWAFAGVNLGLGAGLGLWGAYFWGQSGDAGYLAQMPAAVAVFAAGQILLPGGVVPGPGRAAALWITGGVLALGYALYPLLAAFPMSLILPPALGLCIYAARGCREGDGAELWPALPWQHLPIMPVLPLSAWGAYALGQGSPLVAEMNAWVVLVAGPLSVALLGWATFRALRSRDAA